MECVTADDVLACASSLECREVDACGVGGIESKEAGLPNVIAMCARVCDEERKKAGRVVVYWIDV